jgi:hypothetical protein
VDKKGVYYPHGTKILLVDWIRDDSGACHQKFHRPAPRQVVSAKKIFAEGGFPP